MKWMDGNKDSPVKKCDLMKMHKRMFEIQRSGNWYTNWKTIRDYINPYIGEFEEDNTNFGERKDDLMINTSPLIANNTQAAGMQNGITSPTKPWMKLAIPNTDAMEDDEVKWWCDTVTQEMLNVFARSNFYDSSIEFYKELGAPATAAMMIMEDDEFGIWCRTFTIGEYAIALNKRNQVNRFARLMRMTIAEMIEMFGEDNCPKQVVAKYKSLSVDDYIDVYNLIVPNPEADLEKIDKWSMPFVSFYWCENDNDDYLDIGGYPEFPVMCARWSVKGANVYGMGPGWYALGDSKSLQTIDEDVHVGVKKQVDPPMIAPADIMSAGGVNTLPNGVSLYNRADGDNSIKAAYQVQINLQDAQMLKQEKIDIINKHFFVDLFRMLESVSGTGVTKEEIIQRVNEKMSLIGPVLERLQNEFLRPAITRTFGIMMRNGMLPPPPESIQGMDIKIEYISTMAQQMKAAGISSIEQLASFVASLAQISPSAADKLDVDEAIDRAADMLGTPPSVVRSDVTVSKIREAQQQQQEQIQQEQSLMQAAQGAKTLSDTPIGNNSALDSIVNGMGGVQQ